ncbi:putative ribonuclease H-like domain-containing protein [Tanacetum coccineum]|uniref:Ribonuclease H-like domain-containing protein n=1 Tax=Tanacetum coccineum TaxID=301880 RepID=A0ABQ5DRY9_9ASTR
MKQRKDSGPTKPILDEATTEEYVATLFCDPPKSGDDRMQLTELMDLCTQLQLKVLALKTTKSNQALEIKSLKRRMLFDVQDDLQGEEVVAEKEVAKKEVSVADPVTTAGEVVTTANVEVATASAPTKLLMTDGSSKRYLSMIKMLQNMDREDLETLWKLIKTKHGNTRPEDEYERVLWGDMKSMRMEQYLTNTDNSLWEVIVNGDAPTIASASAGTEGPIPPKTAKQRLARKNELKAKSTLLLANPDEHLLKFHRIKDAKTLWEEIKARFGGNKESNKIQKTILKRQYENFTTLRSEGLDKTYDSPQLENEDLEQIDTDDLEQIDLKWQVAMLSMRVKRFLNKTIRNLNFNSKETVGFDKTKVECYNCHRRCHFVIECRAPRNQGNRNGDGPRRNAPVDTSTTNALVVQDGIGGYDWSFQAEEGITNFALMAYTSQGSSSSDSEDNKMVEKCVLNNKGRVTGQREIRPVWNNAQRVNHQTKLTHPHPKRNFIPTTVATKSGQVPVNAAKQNSLRAAASISTVGPVNIVAPKLKRPTGNAIDHTSKDSGSYMFKRFDYVDLQGKLSGCSRHMTGNKSFLKDYQEVDGGFVAFAGRSLIGELKFNLFFVSQMCAKKNSVLFTETECLVLSLDFKLLDESQVLLKVPRQNNMYSFDLKNVVSSGGLTCLFVKATIDESNLWHRRLAHINFKTMNKLMRGNLVRGLPSKLFENDHTCVTCQKGKQHKASCKTKLVSSISQPLQMLHMDLFGPTSVRSINHKIYCLVVTDDYNRFSGVFFLVTKDETSEILKTFITGIENQINHKVKIIRCDNETEFKNNDMNQFFRMKGIKREFSVAITPQQNRVAERNNRTLIEAARTMLADSLLPTTFWAKAVSTACYVQNRVLVTKPHNKTPYELLHSRPPSISFKRPFGCPVTILNTLDPLGKFDKKDDEGFFVGYSINSKAFRVFNTKTRKVEENLHINFLKNKPNVIRSGPDWLFDIDLLTNSMNYEPVTTGNQTNKNAVADDAGKETNVEPVQEGERNDNLLVQQKEGYANITNKDSTVSPSISTDGKNFTNANDLPTDPFIPKLEDTDIFSGAYDDEDMGAEANLNNLEITMNWVYRNKKDKRGIVVRNKARLVAQGYTQEEGIDYNEIFAPIAMIEAIRLFLAYASFMGFIVYQMDVKSAFLYGTIKEEVYVCQPSSFEDPQFPVQAYVDDIIFGSIKNSLCVEFEQMMHKKFQMSSMGELTFFLGLQIMQKDDGIFISQRQDEEAEDVDVHLYRSMIGSFMYLTASRPDIIFAICACTRFQVTPKSPHLNGVKRDFRYLKASLDRKSTTGGCQFLGKRLISWQCKKQTIVANSTTEAEYVAAANCCGQVLWIQNQMLDYGFNFMNTKIHIDNESTICIVKNLVFHSKTKHIEIRHHFIRDSYEKKLIQVIKIHTDHNVADLLTKAFDVSRPIHLVADELVYKEWEDKMERAATIASSLEAEQDSDETVYKEWEDRMERAATTASSLEAEQDSGNINRTQSMATLNESLP